MNRADRKRIIFHTFRNALMTVGGVAPIFAILSTDGTVQKVLNAITSVSVLILGVLSVSAYATEHRRAGYLIDSLIQEWRSGIGLFAGKPENEAFRELIRQTKIILDSSETSFIGAGTATESARELPGSKAELVAPVAVPPSKQSTIPSVPPVVPAQRFTPPPPPMMVPDDAIDLDWGAIGDIVTQDVPDGVAEENFAAWQAAALAQSEENHGT